MIKAVFFDMNETMLNLSALKEKFDHYFDDDHVIKYWFAKLLHSSAVFGIMKEYENFGILAKAALETIFHENGKELPEEVKSEILGAFRNLPAYNDVAEAVTILKGNAIRTVAVSNSSLEMIKEQLTNAEIINLFDAYYSVDSVKTYKPFKNVYRYAARQENIPPEHIVMIASHDWDLFGAKKAGFKTAYIERKRTLFNPCYPQPDISSTDMRDLAREIISISKNEEDL